MAEHKPTRTLVDADDAADYLGLSPITLAEWRSKGKGPTYRKFGRRVKYLVSDLDAYIDANGHSEQVTG